jgi:ribosomal protein S18 acetylase RimI-like enzyme
MVYKCLHEVEKSILQQLSIDAYGMYKNILTLEGWNSMSNVLNNDEMWMQLINNSTIIICENEESIIGSAYLISSGHPTEIYPADWSYIRMISVHPNYQGMGIASHLTCRCIEYAKARNERVIALHTAEIMTAARSI